MARLSQERWHGVRTRYEESTVAVRLIASEAGVAECSIYAKARREGWRRRSIRSEQGDAARIERAVARLLHLSDQLSRDMTELGASGAAEGERIGSGEGDVEGDTGRGRQDRLDRVERQAKLLQSLVRSVQSLARLAGGGSDGRTRARPSAGVSDGGGGGGGDSDADDLLLMRRELARRLDRAVERG